MIFTRCFGALRARPYFPTDSALTDTSLGPTAEYEPNPDPSLHPRQATPPEANTA